MNPEAHERACRLIDARLVEGISASEREWLEGHLTECPTCESRASANARALQALRSNTVSIDPALVGTTQARVRWRARELRDNQARLRALWISCGLSWLLGAVTAPLLWEAIAWLGRRFDVSQAVWIAVFAMCWLAPATLVGAVIAWKHSPASGARNGHTAWERWR
jgi:anti-sigma factor RsiW